MKKLFKKDKNLRKIILKNEHKHFILKSILKNLNFFALIRWNALLILNNLSLEGNKFSLVSRCLYSINRKKFNKLTTFSRHVYLKLIRSGQIHGMRKSNW